MKRGLVRACAALLVGSGWTLAQAPQPTVTTPPVKPAVRPVQATVQDLQGGIVPPGAAMPSGPISPGARATRKRRRAGCTVRAPLRAAPPVLVLAGPFLVPVRRPRCREDLPPMGVHRPDMGVPGPSNAYFDGPGPGRAGLHLRPVPRLRQRRLLALAPDAAVNPRPGVDHAQRRAGAQRHGQRRQYESAGIDAHDFADQYVHPGRYAARLRACGRCPDRGGQWWSLHGGLLVSIRNAGWALKRRGSSWRNCRSALPRPSTITTPT